MAGPEVWKSWYWAGLVGRLIKQEKRLNLGDLRSADLQRRNWAVHSLTKPGGHQREQEQAQEVAAGGQPAEISTEGCKRFLWVQWESGEDKPCQTQDLLGNDRGWRWEGYSGDEGTCGCPACAPSYSIHRGQRMESRLLRLAGKEGCCYVLILCWSFCSRFWFTSLISTRPSPNWVDWPWLLHSRQLIKDWLISSLNGWHLAGRLRIACLLPPQTCFMLQDL